MKALATSRPLLRILLKAMYAHIDVLLYIKVTIGELYWLLHAALQHPPHPLQQVVTPGYYGSCRSLPCCRQSVWCRRAAVLQCCSHCTLRTDQSGEARTLPSPSLVRSRVSPPQRQWRGGGFVIIIFHALKRPNSF